MDVEVSTAAPAAATEETMTTAAGAAVATPDADAFDSNREKEVKDIVHKHHERWNQPEDGDDGAHALALDAWREKLFCPKRHALEAHSSKYEWICNRCHAHQALGTLVYTCHHGNPGTDPCDYDVCETCCKPAPPPGDPPLEEGDPVSHEEGPPHLRCPNRHSLHKVISHYEWHCNRCGSIQKVKTFVYTCWLGDGHKDLCDYHVCEDCCMDNPSEYDHPALTPNSHDEDGHYYEW